MKFLSDFWIQLVHIFTESGFFILLGFLIAGVLHVLISDNLAKRLKNKSHFGGMIRAVILGIPIPICSCGVLPASFALKDKEVKDSATASFLVATPSTGMDSIFAGFGMLGIPLTIAKIIVSVIAAFFTGSAVAIFGKEQKSGDETAHCEAESCSIEKPVQAPKMQLSMVGHDHQHGMMMPMEEEKPACPKCAAEAEKKKSKFAEIFRYGFGRQFSDIALALFIGLLFAALVGALFENVISPDVIAPIASSPFWSLLLMLVIGLPLYVCATGSIPVALGFLAIGFSPGSIMVFLLAGPATNIAAVSLIKKKFGTRFLVIFLISIAAFSVLLGYGTNLIFDALYPGGFTLPMMAEGHVSWLPNRAAVASALLMAALIPWGIWKEKIAPKLKKS